MTAASLHQILDSYDDQASLSDASTIPAPWYVDPRIYELEQQAVFSKTSRFGISLLHRQIQATARLQASQGKC